MDTLYIINKYYNRERELRELLLIHSRQVAVLAREIAMRLQGRGVEVDADFVQEGAMLHDIGIIQTDAPGILCHGSEPYIRHGILGAEMLRGEGLPRHALVCERHTGAGLSLNDIVSQNLPLPHRDFLPVSVEEKIICYADKFFSKSHPAERRTLAVARAKLEKFGPETLARFDDMTRLFL